jgi:hypothetical protein
MVMAPEGPEPRMTVLAKASSNLPERRIRKQGRKEIKLRGS